MKGLGIVAVVAGHIFTGPLQWAIFLWHMPLFFVLSGMLLPRRDESAVQYGLKKARSLLLPYCSFLVVLALPHALNAFRAGELLPFIGMLAYGGTRLNGWFSVFWFVPVLFLAQQIAYGLQGRVCPGGGWSAEDLGSRCVP